MTTHMTVLQSIQTARISAYFVEVTDTIIIEQIFRENYSTCALLEAQPDNHAVAREIVTYSDLPPNGISDNFRNFILHERTKNEPLGILSCYLGYPHLTTCYIGRLFLRPSWHRKGYGQELIRELEHQVLKAGYTENRVSVGLKNWPALRFWTKQGYNNVTLICGDNDFADDHYANMELCKNLNPNKNI